MNTINHPQHYTQGAIEAIDIIEVWNLGFHRGAALKYILRAPYKGKPVEDYRKAAWYLRRYADAVNNLHPVDRGAMPGLAALSVKAVLKAWKINPGAMRAQAVHAIAYGALDTDLLLAAAQHLEEAANFWECEGNNDE